MKKELLRTRVDRIGLLVLAALVLIAVFLVASGNPRGQWLLLLMAGGLVSTVIVLTADLYGIFRKPVLVAGISSLPVYLVLWMLLMIFLPGVGGVLDPFFFGGSDSVNVLGALLYGFTMVASIMSFGRLANPRHRPGS